MGNVSKPVTICIALVVGILTPVSTALAAGTIPPSRVATSTPGTGTATITWAAATSATAYQARVLIGSVPIKTSASLPASARTYTFTGLEYKVPIKLQVRSLYGTWSTYGDTDPITPVAASPSTPDPATVSVLADKKIKAEWTLPSSDGGSPIASYSIQLLKGSEPTGEPITSTALQIEMDTADTTSSYSVTIAAINSAGMKSSPSEPSAPIAAKKQAVATVDLSPGAPSGGGGGAPSSGGGGGTPSSGNSPATNTEKAPTTKSPEINQSTQVVSPVPGIPAYTKVIKVRTRVTGKTLVTLSKLTVLKGSTTNIALSSSSKKYCQQTGTTVKSLKAGTCLIKVTVTSKSGVKKSRTVKLISR
ncbi:MAG: hypothetical protein NTV13_01000 [Actinobacteria bacterium]|nr:hypothetical protein [Actinomycetota bacterium]